MQKTTATRLDREKLEDKLLAPYAQKSSRTRGRKHPQVEHPLRTTYHRDRDRIVHCRAFRRLEYKTQVFVNSEGDHYRTRLTHTMEVASISRAIARTLKLNEDLTEAIALSHDLGHPPFGHSGEDVLNDLMGNHGGFEHNLQSLRIVELLERKYPEFDGLNLSWEVREGIAMHATPYDLPSSTMPGLKNSPSLEAQITNYADEIAYSSHDIDDGLASGLIAESDLDNLKIWQKVYHKFEQQHPVVDDEIKRYFAVRNLIDYLSSNLIHASRRKIADSRVQTTDQVRKKKELLITFSPQTAQLLDELKKFLYQNLYMHKRVASRNQKARLILTELFRRHIKKPTLLTQTTQRKLKSHELHRVVCDYIAGMTDRYALLTYNRLTSRSERL